MWKDYDLANEATWTVMEAPPVDPSWIEQLTRIGGLNPFKQPMLVWRWGATYRDPMAVDNGLKYWLCNRESTLMGFEYTDPATQEKVFVKREAEVPSTVLIAVPKYTGQIQLGERRIIIEQWRSPEFLARSGRYQETMLLDPGKTYEWYFCRNCNWSLVCNGPDTEPQPCPRCGSHRYYQRTHREEGDGRLLRSFPREGCYDYFLRLENELGEPLPPDANALRQIAAAWAAQQTRTDADRQHDVDDATAKQRALQTGAVSPSNPFVGPFGESARVLQ